MFLVDGLLLAPFNGLLWVFQKVHEAAQEELAGEADALTAELSRLYTMLETGRIGEDEFTAQERTLLDRLDAVEERALVADDGDDEERDGTVE